MNCEECRESLPGAALGELAPAQQRLLATVGDPALVGVDLFDRAGQLVPVGVVREDEPSVHGPPAATAKETLPPEYQIRGFARFLQSSRPPC